jgi:predicted signal transduction protein with EAL and GGDEF domain
MSGSTRHHVNPNNIERGDHEAIIGFLQDAGTNSSCTSPCAAFTSRFTRRATSRIVSGLKRSSCCACKMPDRSDFEGMIIEINGTEAVRHLDLLKEVAGQLRFHKIEISIDDLGAEWPSLVGIHDFPFVKLKVDRKFIAGCADDRLKRTFCRQILDLADGYGARTVAERVETRADFLAVREMGFDLVQGFLFAKPMPAKKFARTMLGRPITASW